MKGYDLYVFFLCLIVFVLLTALFTVLIVWVTRLLIRLIRGGLEDEAIKKEYYKVQCGCGGNCVSGIIDKIISVVFCAFFVVFFIFSLSLNLSEEKKVGDVPVMRVVQSGSMSKKYDKNTYLFLNDLNNQIQTFDIIVTEKLPDEMDLKLYDIVVYEVDDMLIVHRIVKIEEPNSKHPDCRWFTLQGDNVQYPDKTPVLYSQMRAIYNGNRIPYIGSFVSFMQSPAGWLCIILIVTCMVAIPVVEKILEREREKRLIALGELPFEGEMLGEWQEVSSTDATPLFPVRERPQEIAPYERKALEGLSKVYAESLATAQVLESYQGEIQYGESQRENLLTERFEEDGFIQKPLSSVKPLAQLLMEQGYSIKNVRVKLLKKQKAFSGNGQLLKMTAKGDTVNVYLGLNVGEKQTEYTLVNVLPDRMKQVLPAQFRITLKRDKGGKNE